MRSYKPQPSSGRGAADLASRRRRGLAWAVLLALSLLGSTAHADSRPAATDKAAGAIADTFTGVQRIVAIGDIHGDFERFVQVLKLCKLIDDKNAWSGGKAHLVQTGDVVDRGPDSKKAMDLLMQLEEQARRSGGAVHALLGNHEYMTMAGDLRYVSSGELAAFGEAPRATPVGAPPERPFPAYQAAFAPTGKYGRWLLTHNAIVRVNDTLFMHGGLSPAFLRRKIHDLNEAVRAELRGERDARSGVGADPSGPLWYRGLAESMQEQVLSAFLDELFAAQGARRIVMGHTIQDRGITLRADGRLALIDVGMSRWTLGGAPSCLVIERQAARAATPPGTPPGTPQDTQQGAQQGAQKTGGKVGPSPTETPADTVSVLK